MLPLRDLPYSGHNRTCICICPQPATRLRSPTASRGCQSHPYGRTLRGARSCVRAAGSARSEAEQEQKPKHKRVFALQDLLGPIGLTLQSFRPGKAQVAEEEAFADRRDGGPEASTSNGHSGSNGVHVDKSISSMTTEQWRAQYEPDGAVDLWLEDEYNAGSRLKGGRDTHKGNLPGFGSGEGRSAGTAPKHSVTIHNHHADQTVQVDVPEDRYILWEAEDKGLLLPYACRMGCCTACAVRVKSGEMHQPQSLGVSREMQEAGYGLMCVGYPKTDLVLETVEEDEVYDQQFGQYFAQFATNPNDRNSISRDDFALELADMDE